MKIKIDFKKLKIHFIAKKTCFHLNFKIKFNLMKKNLENK